jgi:pyruvate-ferredoxin/flavodoxin oxidoreductase
MIRKKETMDGNTAAAHVAYAFTDVAAIFPITPSSAMAELTDEWSATGKKNIFGNTVMVQEMQSEGGAAGTIHGLLQSGALATTFTSGQGLLLMIPNMYKMAGELLPGVFHVAARSLSSNVASIMGDHQDVMSTRQTGFTILASSSVQQVMDLSAVAHLSAIKSSVPILHFFDGFRTSHEVQKIDVLEYDELAELIDYKAIDNFRGKSLTPNRPVLRGVTVNDDIFFQTRESVNRFHEEVPEIVQDYMNEINKLTNRDYKLFNYHGAPDATEVIVAMGSGCMTIKEVVNYLNRSGEKVGLIEVHLFRPFSSKHLLSAIPKTAKKITVLDRTKEPGSEGEPLLLDVRSAYYGTENAPIIIGGRFGLSSRDFQPKDVMAVFENMSSEKPKDHFTVGVIDDVTFKSLPMYTKKLEVSPEDIVSCKFWGFGSDGTVGANNPPSG